MRRFAQGTTVPVARSKQAIEELLRRHGATQFATGWDDEVDRMQFMLFGRLIRFVLPRPDATTRPFTHDKRGARRTPARVAQAVDQAERQRWRAMYLVIRAKLEAVEAGIAIFEQEFLAYVVMPNDARIGDILVPRIQAGMTQGLLTGKEGR